MTEPPQPPAQPAAEPPAEPSAQPSAQPSVQPPAQPESVPQEANPPAESAGQVQPPASPEPPAAPSEPVTAVQAGTPPQSVPPSPPVFQAPASPVPPPQAPQIIPPPAPPQIIPPVRQPVPATAQPGMTGTMPAVPGYPPPGAPGVPAAPTARRTGPFSALVPVGIVPAALALAGLLLLCIALLGPAATISENHGGYTDFTRIRFFGGYYNLSRLDFNSFSGLDLLPVMLTFGLLVLTFGSTGARRAAARLGTAFFGVFAIGLIVSQMVGWTALVHGSDHYTEGTEPSPSPSDTYDYPGLDDDKGIMSLSIGWGVYLMIFALLLLIAAAATTFELGGSGGGGGGLFARTPAPGYGPQQPGAGAGAAYAGPEVQVSPDPPAGWQNLHR